MDPTQTEFEPIETDILNTFNDMSASPTICISCSSTTNTLVKLDCSHIFCRPCLFRRFSSGNPNCQTCLFPFAPSAAKSSLLHPPLDLRNVLDEVRNAARKHPVEDPIIVNTCTTRSALSELFSLTQDQILSDLDEEAENAVFGVVAVSLMSYNSDGWWATYPAQFKVELEHVVKVSLLEELKTLHSKELVALGCDLGDGDDAFWNTALRVRGGVKSVKVQAEVWQEILELLVDWAVWWSGRDLEGP